MAIIPLNLARNKENIHTDKQEPVEILVLIPLL